MHLVLDHLDLLSLNNVLESSQHGKDEEDILNQVKSGCLSRAVANANIFSYNKRRQMDKQDKKKKAKQRPGSINWLGLDPNRTNQVSVNNNGNTF